VTSWTPRCSHTTRIDLLILPLFLSRSFSPNHLSLFHPWVPGPFVPHPPFTPASVLAAQLPESLLSRLLLAAAAGEPESEPAPHRHTSPRPPTTCRHCPCPDWARTRRCATLRQARRRCYSGPDSELDLDLSLAYTDSVCDLAPRTQGWLWCLRP
jgi:hypothetical protein